MGAENEETLFRKNGVTTVGIAVIPQPGANYVKIADEFYKRVEKLNAEKNQIIRKWNESGIESRTAFETQALLQLKNNYCDQKRCLNCQLGAKIITLAN